MGKRGPEKQYPVRLNSVTTCEQQTAIKAYAKRHGLRWGEAVRELIEWALQSDKGRWPAFHKAHLVKTHRAPAVRSDE